LALHQFRVYHWASSGHRRGHRKRGGTDADTQDPGGEIYYEVHGSRYPLMLFAPGGLRSELSFWRHSPSNPSAPAVWMDPMAELGKKYRVVAMDQRNAGRSRHGSMRAMIGTPTPAISLRSRIISGSTGSMSWAAASAPRIA
jgi:pimeloyl-ACP methyl ester carboxylesterase